MHGYITLFDVGVSDSMPIKWLALSRVQVRPSEISPERILPFSFQ